MCFLSSYVQFSNEQSLCNFIIHRSKKTTSNFAFSLILDSNDVGSLDFVASDQQVFDYWVDGINALLGNRENYLQSYLREISCNISLVCLR